MPGRYNPTILNGNPIYLNCSFPTNRTNRIWLTFIRENGQSIMNNYSRDDELCGIPKKNNIMISLHQAVQQFIEFITQVH
jgi:hypothetical protein